MLHYFYVLQIVELLYSNDNTDLSSSSTETVTGADVGGSVWTPFIYPAGLKQNTRF